MDCLSKDPGGRPATIDAFERRLMATPQASDWTAEHARQWWSPPEPARSLDFSALREFFEELRLGA
jgi:hypothetical protein